MNFEKLENKEQPIMDISSDKAKLSSANKKNANDELGGIRDWIKINSNPYNWSVSDYSSEKNFKNAFNKAKNNGEDEFIRNEKRYTTITKNTPGSKITKRDDFDGNRLSNSASGGKRSESYGKLGDLYRYFGGLQLKDNALYISKYKPTLSKNKSMQYVAINDDDFINQILNKYDQVFNKKELIQQKGRGGNETKINDTTYKVSLTHITEPGSALGNIFISKGSDKKGNYVSYYDIFDRNTGKINMDGFDFNATKPFEIYDRIYIKDYGDGKEKRMYYSDNELKSLDIKLKNFDTLALQRELNNRGYILSESTKTDGTLDGILGEETKKALLYRQGKS